MEYNEIEIKSNIEDFCGKWSRADVEDEIRECVGIPPAPGDWIEFVIDSAIDVDDYETGKMVDAIAKNNLVEDIKIRIPNDGWIRITKKK